MVFLQMFIYRMDGGQRSKDLSPDEFIIQGAKDGFLLLSLYSGNPLDLC